MAELYRHRNRRVELLHSFQLGAIVSREVVAAALKDHHGTGARRFKVAAQLRSGGRASSGSFVVFIPGQAARQCEFRARHPKNALGRKQGQRSRIVQSFRQSATFQVDVTETVHTSFRRQGSFYQSLAADPPLISFLAEKQISRREWLLSDASEELLRGHRTLLNLRRPRRPH